MMKVSSLPKYSINPPPTEEELNKAERIRQIAMKELENEPLLSAEETIKKFEEIRQDIINQCRKNGTLNEIE